MLILCIVQNKSKKSNCFSGIFERKEIKKKRKGFSLLSPIPPIYSLLKEKK